MKKKAGGDPGTLNVEVLGAKLEAYGSFDMCQHYAAHIARLRAKGISASLLLFQEISVISSKIYCSHIILKFTKTITRVDS